MLPARSTRYVGLDGEIPRLHLVSPVQLGLIAVLMLTLFGVLFSPKSLVERLYTQNPNDGLTLSYLQNLYHSDPHNADVAILLARAQQDTFTIEYLDEVLQEFTRTGDPRQRNAVRMILLRAYRRALAGTSDESLRQSIQTRQYALVQQSALDDDVDALAARMLADTAFAVRKPQLGLYFLRRSHPQGNASEDLQRYARQALSLGDYETAAACYFALRNGSTQRDQAREMYQRAVDALMANSQFDRAMELAAQYLGDLDSDPQTLRYLVRVARAAGHPDLAARYAWLLVAAPAQASAKASASGRAP